MAFQWPGGQSSTTQAILHRCANLADAAESYEPVNWAAPTRYSYWSQRCSVIIATGYARAADQVLKRILATPQPRSPPALRPPAR